MRRILISLSFFLISGILIGAEAQTKSAPKRVERGLASWYGAPYSGRPSASGEIYNQEDLTAAHRTLPFGTEVKVRRLDQRRSVMVRINDRGPFVENRIIDVSHAAAEILDMMERGVVPVALDIVATPPRDPRRAVWIEPDSPGNPNPARGARSHAPITVTVKGRATTGGAGAGE